MPKDKDKPDNKDDLFEIDAEIFAVGRWNGMDFALEDLLDFAISFAKLKEVHKVPLKMGHNEDQPFTDGQPALGWVSDVWVDKPAGKLMAKFSEVPELVYNAIKKGLYKHVSIEADFGVEHSGNYYGNVLSGVALLGADIPAVNTLKDLKTYMSKDGAGEYKFTKRQVFTLKQEDTTMPTVEELQAQLAAQKAEFSRKEKEQEDALKTEREKNAQFAAEQKKAEFTRNKAEFSASLETLVKEKKMTPAQRDKLIEGVKDEATLASAQFTAEMFKDGPTLNIDDKGDTAGEKEGDEYTDPSAELSKRAAKFSRDHKVSYMDAVHSVMEDDPELAREYVTVNGQ